MRESSFFLESSSHEYGQFIRSVTMDAATVMIGKLFFSAFWNFLNRTNGLGDTVEFLPTCCIDLFGGYQVWLEGHGTLAW